jgi:hypothetical protein
MKWRTKIKLKKQSEIDNNILEGEIWRPITIEHFRHYSISNKGRVKSNIRQGGGGFVNISIGKRGYKVVSIRNKDLDNKTHTFTIHRLIALAFIDNPDNLPCVDHINRNKTDNRIENLRWCSYSLNAKNREVKGCIHESSDKYTRLDGNVTVYNSYRVFYRGKSKKRFKTRKEAEDYLESIRYDDHYIQT